MKPTTVMMVAGEPSGDMLGAELARALRNEFVRRAPVSSRDLQPMRTGLDPRFFGAGGAHMARAGVELAVDMTSDSVIGLGDVVRKLLKFRRLFNQLLALACFRQPEIVVCVDFSGFNRRFGHAVRKRAGSGQSWFSNWRPKLVQYVSPQVWASRPGRAELMARDFDLLLSIFPFEPAWYARRVPNFSVQFVGHPIIERYKDVAATLGSTSAPGKRLLLLPGSRPGELRRHLPVMLPACEGILRAVPGCEAQMVVPDEALLKQALAMGVSPNVKTQVGRLAEALQGADLAIASTGTVTMECAYFGVPTVALYKTSWGTYQVGKRIILVRFLAMPNLLANEEIFPEFIQHAATPQNLAKAAIDLLNSPERRAEIKRKLSAIRETLGEPGAERRAAAAILDLLPEWRTR